MKKLTLLIVLMLCCNIALAQSARRICDDETHCLDINSDGTVPVSISGTATFDGPIVAGGDVILEESGDNRSVTISGTDPHLRVYSADESQANDYIEMYHNQTSAIIGQGSAAGLFIIDSSDSVILDALNGQIEFREDGIRRLHFRLDDGNAQTNLSMIDAIGNHLNITTDSNRSRDHDHNTTTNPTLFIHSATSPDTDNTQYISLSHDQAGGVLASGTGSIQFTDNLIITAKDTADPCTAASEGAIFWNDTANALCVCDGTNDVRVTDGTTACF